MPRNRSLLHSMLVVLLLCASLIGVRHSTNTYAAGPFVVNTTRDLLGNSCGADASFASLCSLRQALNAAIVAGGNSTVSFNIPTSDSFGTMPGFDGATQTWTIALDSALPLIQNVNGIVIDGGSQAVFSGLSNPGPLVFLDGTDVDNRGGLTIIGAANAQVLRLGIINFGGDPGISGDLAGVGIEISSSTGTKVRGCYVGVNQAGSGSAPNDAAGIMIQGGSDNIIGGNNSLNSEFNVLSGNTNDGVLVRFSSNNQIIGNRIGTNAAGAAAIANGGNGVQLVLGSTGNRIGPDVDFSAGDSTQRNIIAGNNSYGVLINESNTTKVNGNWIGANNLLNLRLPNKLGGVAILSTNASQATGNLVGGNTASTRNIIAGNNGPGVALLGALANNNTIANNQIGIGFSNSVPVSNTLGILISGGGDNNIIGGNGTTTRNNVISGNNGDAVRISGISANPAIANIISGNLIGTDLAGLIGRPNNGAGVAIQSYTRQTRVGGDTTAAGNTIAFNAANGLVISGTAVLSSTVLGNTINANTGNGIRISSTGTTTTTIKSNQIGATSGNCGSPGVGNSQNGVQIDGGARVATIIDNTISRNGQNGVLVSGQGTQQAKISNNKLSRNCAKPIELNPETTGSSGDPANPNHDINPPFVIHLNQAGVLTGRVLVNTSSAATRAASCFECTIEIYATDRNVLDGEGRDRMNSAVTLTSNGYFTATLPSVPQQIALTATDSSGNTSEFAVLTSTLGLDIGPARSSLAKPGDVITYTHRVTNTGAIDFTDLLLSAVSEHNWPYTLTPNSAFSLAAGQSRDVALRLTLPTGADKRVAAGTVEHTGVTVRSTAVATATDTVTDTTTVQGTIVLVATPPSLSGNGTPGTTIPYAHNITNNGNITATLTLTASTDLPGWKTTVTTSTLTLGPGQTSGIVASVTVPPTALITSPPAKTRITITPINPVDPSQTLILTDTTTVTLNPLATLVPAAIEVDAGANETVALRHTVTNLSNGQATFKLFAVSSLGSKITFISVSGAQLVNGNTFTLGIDPTSNTMTFDAQVTVDVRALAGQKDQITIYLTDANNNVIGGATAQDIITVTRGAIVPRLLLPIILVDQRP